MSTLNVNNINEAGGVDAVITAGVLDSGSLPAGSILQVVHASTSTETTTTSTSFVSSGLSASITPSSTNSKVLIIVSIAAKGSTTAQNTDLFGYEITRDATQVFTDGAARYGIRFGSSGSHNNKMSLGVNYLDTPASTSSLTYAINFKVRDASNSGTAVAQPDDMPSTITLMEVAG